MTTTSTPGAVRQFRLPDVGEGLTEADIVSWRVRPGDPVADGDVIVEIETAKSLVELPCPFDGVVDELLVTEGSTVDVGTPIISVRTGGAGPAGVPDGVADGVPDGVPGSTAGPAGTTDEASREEPGTAQAPGGAAAGRTPVLVGYGPRTGPAVRRRRRPVAESAPVDGAAADLAATELVPQPDAEGPAEEPVPTGPTGTAGDASASDPSAAASVRALAKPPVRRLAKDLGVDLAALTPTGPGGTVTRDDVRAAAAGATPSGASGATPSGSPGGSPPENGAGPVAADQVRETRTPVRGVRRHTAEAMVASAFTAPHVTEWVQVDVTRSMKLLRRLRADPRFEGVRISPLTLVAKALLVAVARHPEINATLDATAGEHGEIVVKHYVNLGIAAATPRGLVVPVVRDADRMGLRELAEAITDLAATARAGRTPPAAMTGGTVTITNVGVFGVDGGTPILNPGESAILAVGQVARRPWVHRGRVRPRWVTTLALSFDHRVVDGELGSRVLADVAAVLTDPATALA